MQNNWINSGVNNEKVLLMEQLNKEHSSYNQRIIVNKNLFSSQHYFQFYDSKIAIIDNNYQPNYSNQKLNLDILLITQNTRLSIAELLNQFSPQQIIIDASNSIYTSKRLKEEASDLNINCWSVLLDGAFVQNI